MAKIEPRSPHLKTLKGIHLWHAGLSSCSQRVRLVLAELEQGFESHMVNLPAGEQASEAYLKINPNGVVPALVHDGTLIIESMDIMAYLDDVFGNGQLRGGGNEDEVSELLARNDLAPGELKVCTYEFLFSGRAAMPDNEFEAFLKMHPSKKAAQFHREVRAGFARDRVHDAVTKTDSELQFLEGRLADGRTWLTGEAFSMADIAWLPNLHRVDLLRWPLDRYPHLSDWFERACARESYKTALQAWEPKPMLDVILPLLDKRRENGDGVDNYGALAG